MSRATKTAGAFLTLGIFLVAFNLGGSAGCGSAVRGATASGSGGDAAEGATSAATAAANAGAGASSAGVSGLVVQALTLNNLAALKAEVINIPETSYEASIPCSPGTADVSVTISGTVTVNDTTEDLESVDIDFEDSTVFTECTPEDIASTDEVDESDYTLDGTLSGTGSISGNETTVNFEFSSDGDLVISGACSGSLTFGLTITGSVSGATSRCEASGGVSGSCGGESVTCTVSGSCDDPAIDC